MHFCYVRQLSAINKTDNAFFLQTLVRAEIKNNNIPLDSYDTFRLNTSEHQPKPYIEVTTEAVTSSSMVPEMKTKVTSHYFIRK